MTFFILLSLVAINYQLYKLSNFAIAKDEMELDFLKPKEDKTNG